ncbi:MAG: hypothetical protein AAF560_34375, partial [Acidobacteriota bacterium]
QHVSAAMAGRAERRAGLQQHLPEPAKFWISYAPRRWRAAGGPWTDLASGRLQGLSTEPAGDPSMPAIDAAELNGTLYVPPLVPELVSERSAWLRDVANSGTSTLLQLQPGDLAEADADVVVYDLFRPLLAANLEALDTLAAGGNAVWPLIPGWTDDPGLWAESCAVMAHAGVTCVQPIAVELPSSDRRCLAELGGEKQFDALFHGGEAPSERAFSQTAARHGLRPFIARPEVGDTPRQRRNRRLAADLALAGELWLRLDRSVAIGQGLLKAAREAESSAHDLKALVFEGNLSVLTWLNSEAVELIQQAAAGEDSSLVAALMQEYLDA